MDQTPDLARAIITVEIDAIPLRHGTPIDKTTCNRAAAFCMTVFGYRLNHSLGTAILIIMRPFAKTPAKVCATGRAFREKINLLPGVLTDIANIQVTCCLIE